MDFSLKNWFSKHFLLLIIIGIGIAVVELQALPIESASPQAGLQLLLVPSCQLVQIIWQSQRQRFSHRWRWTWTERRAAKGIAGFGCQFSDRLQRSQRLGEREWMGFLLERHQRLFVIHFSFWNFVGNFIPFFIIQFRHFPKQLPAPMSHPCWTRRRAGAKVKSSARN